MEEAVDHHLPRDISADHPGRGDILLDNALCGGTVCQDSEDKFTVWRCLSAIYTSLLARCPQDRIGVQFVPMDLLDPVCWTSSNYRLLLVK